MVCLSKSCNSMYFEDLISLCLEVNVTWTAGICCDERFPAMIAPHKMNVILESRPKNLTAKEHMAKVPSLKGT